MITLHLIYEAQTLEDPAIILPVGSVVEYLGHLPGGMIRVRDDRGECTIHPMATEELR